MYDEHRIEIILLLLGLLLFFVNNFVFTFSIDFQWVLFYGTILLIGVPHGAFD